MLKKADVTEKNDNILFNEQRLLTDLVAELAIALHEKATLQSRNSELMLECQTLKHEFANYERTASEEKNCLTQKLKKYQEIVHEKEIALAEKDVQLLQERKKHLKEVNELKDVYNKQNDLYTKREQQLKQEMDSLKTKINEANENYSKQTKIVNTYNNKYITYKAKMKHALGVINSLTATLATHKHKPTMFNKESQTETKRKRLCESCKSLTSLQNIHTTTNENIVLTELFFKPHPPENGIETMFFIANQSNEHFKKVTFK